MGLLIDGKWHVQWYDTKATQGKFVRSQSQFRNWVMDPKTYDENDKSHFPAESGRYHLYVSLACPWAHRTLIFRHLKKLESHISVSCVHPHMLENGWEFNSEQRFHDNEVPSGDPLHEFQFAHQLYTHANNEYSGRVTVPILWDKKTQTIVSNESADIIRMFNTAFNHITGDEQDFYPEPLRSEIDALNERIYDTVNNGVYKSGFATTQKAYEEAIHPLFESLEFLESRLENSTYLTGDTVTEADWRLFTTLIRFDSVYHGHFKCNIKRILDFPNLNRYLESLYRTQDVSKTVNFDHIKQHYYFSHDTINPTRVVPVGPVALFRSEL